MRHTRRIVLTTLTASVLFCAAPHAAPTRAELAERFFRGVYGCEPSVVDEVAADDIMLSYPIFAKIFGSPVIRGRDAARAFATGFCERWADPEVTVHETVEGENKVVLVWSFRARAVAPADENRPASGEVQSWGGISLFRFDTDGKITAEIGEESEPGPFARTLGSGEPD